MHINFCLAFYGTLLGIEGPFQKFCFRNFKCLYCCNFSANLQSRVEKGRMSQEKCERTLSLLTGVLDYKSFKDVDMVIEARQSITPFFFLMFLAFYYKFFFLPYLILPLKIVSWQAVIENVSLKQQIFADLEKFCSPHCILATNTSTIDLNLIGEKTMSQDRIVGAHFFR